METFYTIALNFLFYATCILTVIAVIFIFFGLSKRLLLSFGAILVVITPYYLSLNKIINAGFFSFMSTVGFCLFPVSIALLIQYQYKQQRQLSIMPVSAVSSISFFILIVTPARAGIIVSILYLLAYMYISYMLWPLKRDIFKALVVAVLFLHLAYVSIILYALDNIHLAISTGSAGIVLSIILAFYLKNKLTMLITQLNRLKDMNKNLNRQVSRLVQSNESYRNIMLEKDQELHQMSRHASLAELTTGIAHELAQPLTGIKGIAQNMIDDINEEEFENLQAVSELLKICSLIDKSSSIIDHIRNFSKKSTLSMKPIDLNKIILDAIDLIQNQLKKNNIDLIFVLDEKIPKIIGDKISLDQLIVNIILNSKDAIIEKEFESPDEYGTIRITTFFSGNMVTMIIQDNGSGISEDIMHKIWSPFFTTKKRKHGTGIGLSICSKILKDHNAEVDIQSDTQGTQFVISFPITAGTNGPIQ